MLCTPAPQFPTGVVLRAGPARPRLPRPGRAARRVRARGRLRRRVPLRPRPGGRAPGAGPGAGDVRRLVCKALAPGLGCLAGRAALACRDAGGRKSTRRYRPPVLDQLTLAVCSSRGGVDRHSGARGSSTGAGAACWSQSNGSCRARPRAWRPGCTWSSHLPAGHPDDPARSRQDPRAAIERRDRLRAALRSPHGVRPGRR